MTKLTDDFGAIDYYAELEIAPESDARAIWQQYQHMQWKYDPEREGAWEEMKAIMPKRKFELNVQYERRLQQGLIEKAERIRGAGAVLCDPRLRENYHRILDALAND